MIRDIYLHGSLAEKFVSKLSVEVSSVAEAIRAIEANFNGFYAYILNNCTEGLHIKVGDVYRDTTTLLDPLTAEDIHIIPAISGSGKVGTIIVAAFLIWATWGAAAAAAPGASAAAGSTYAGSLAYGAGMSASTAAIVGQFGVGLLMSGISQLLFAPPKAEVQEAAENTPNTYFNGAVNTIAQGHPVPVGYGELIVGSAVISAGISVDSGNMSYSWLFTSVGSDGWTLLEPNIYYNTGTLITYNSINETYEKEFNEGYSQYFGEQVQYIPTIGVYTYYRLQNRFYKTSGCDLVFDAKYCQTGGSSDVPIGWA